MIDFTPPFDNRMGYQTGGQLAAVSTRTSAPQNADVRFQRPFLPDVQDHSVFFKKFGKSREGVELWGAAPATDFKAENAAVDQEHDGVKVRGRRGSCVS